MSIKFTNKQIEILNVIKAGTKDGPCSVYDIMERLAYPVKRDALLHSIKILIDNGYVERAGPVKRGLKTLQVFRVTTKTIGVI